MTAYRSRAMVSVRRHVDSPMRTHRGHSVRTTLAPIALGALLVLACRARVPDVGGFDPILEEDGRIVELLSEADTLSDRDPAGAATNLREIVLPRAQRNWNAAGALTVTEPRAHELLRELVAITAERVDTVRLYADALQHSDVASLRDVIARQAALDQRMDRFEAAVQAAKQAPAARGCSR